MWGLLRLRSYCPSVTLVHSRPCPNTSTRSSWSANTPVRSSLRIQRQALNGQGHLVGFLKIRKTSNQSMKIIFFFDIWAASRKKGPWRIFYQNVYFSIFWMYIIFRLFCEIFSKLAVKISFLWGPKHVEYATASFSSNVTSWCSRNDTHFFTSVILHMNIIFIAQ